MSDHSSVYTAYRGNTYLFGGNAPYVEEMYENYLANPGSVPDHWLRGSPPPFLLFAATDGTLAIVTVVALLRSTARP